MNHFKLLGLLLLVACQQPDTHLANTTRVDSSQPKPIEPIVTYDLSDYVKDTSFINKGIEFIVWRDTTDKKNRFYNSHVVSCIVEKIDNKQRDTVLEFIAYPEFDYKVADKDGDGNTDIVILNDPQKMFRFYMFNPSNDRFEDNKHWYGAWIQLGNSICFNYPIDLKGPNLNSNLFVVENGQIYGLGFIDVEAADDNEWNDTYFSMPPKVSISKIKKGHFLQIEWTEDISEEIVKKYIAKDREDHEGLCKEIWQSYYKRFL
jgi:hypothetical protein